VKIVDEIHFAHIRRRMIRIKTSAGNDNDDKDPITLIVVMHQACSYQRKVII
jgi:hypothetical protein